MLKIVVGALGLMFVLAPVAVAQQAIDAVLFEQGQQLYQDNCALCHQDSGAGDPPTFPALSGDDQLGDPALIVSNIHQGKGSMPPFPNLTAEEISSLAIYIRNAWANDFGPVTTEEVEAVLEGLEDIGHVASIWDGVFTEAQATRGQTVYSGACGTCHGPQIEWRSGRSGYAVNVPSGAGEVSPRLGGKIACYAIRIHASDDAGKQSWLSG